MDPLAVVRRRLVTQRLAGEPCVAPAEAVRQLVAVQAQELAEAKWSLGERTRDCTDADVEDALSRGDILRTHVLRPTWHFVARDDIRWLLRVTRHRVHALNAYQYRQCELDAVVLARAHQTLARVLADGEALTRAELARHIAADGVPADGVRLACVVMHAELEEVVCSGPRRGKQQTYALLDHRAPPLAADERSAEAGLDELVLRYFDGHGPATLRDLTAWSSLTVGETHASLERVGSALRREDDAQGRAWYSGRSEVVEPPGRLGGAFLIPMYDETVMGYRDVRVVVEPAGKDFLERAVVIDSRTVGSWSRVLTARKVTVTVVLLTALTAAQRRALDQVVERFGTFLGVQAVLVTVPPG